MHFPPHIRHMTFIIAVFLLKKIKQNDDKKYYV